MSHPLESSTTTASIEISLSSPLTFRNAFRFPLQNRDARHDFWIGGLLALVPIFGWILNMGYRIEVVHRFHKGLYPWPAWNNLYALFKYGLVTLTGMIFYYSLGFLFLTLGVWRFGYSVIILGSMLITIAIVAIPGFMTFYCREFDPREIFNPLQALSRVGQGGKAYWKAWMIVIAALVLSFSGLFVLGIGFAFTSVWFWQVAAFCFANVFTQRFKLDEENERIDF